MHFDPPHVVRQFRVLAVGFDPLRRLQHLLEPRKPNVASLR